MAKHLSHSRLTFARWLRSLRIITRHNETNLTDITDETVDKQLHTDVCELFQLAELQTNLKLKILEYVAPAYCNFHLLSNNFWLLPPDNVDEILRHPLLDRGSMDGVLETLFQWATIHDHRQYLPALLSHLDLCSVSSSYLLRNETWLNQWLNQISTPNLHLSTHSWLQVEVDYRLLQASNSISDKKKDNNEQMLLKFYSRQESGSVSMIGYNTAGKGLQVLKDIPVVLRNEMIAIGFDGYVYFLGGEGSGKIIKYNPATNSIISKGNLACPIYDAAVVQHNSTLYIVGKDLKSEPNYRLQSYNPATGQSKELASANCCCHQPHLFILEGALHIAGSSKESFLTIERYNPARNAWITTNIMFPFSGPWHHAAMCLNKLYLCSKSVLTEENEWLVYDFVSEKWAEQPFCGGPSCVNGLWTVGNPDNAALLLQDEQSLLYTYEVATSQWTILLESIATERHGCKLKHQVVQTLYCVPIAEATQKQDLGPPDVTIACGNLEFVAHRSILSGASPYFHAMLSSEMKEAEIEFPTITAETFERVLEFVYNQKTSRQGMLSVENMLLDLEAAHLMEISVLSASCFSRLADNISMHNYDKLLKAADLYNNKGFKARILTYVAKNLHRFASSGNDLNMNATLISIIFYHPELDAFSLVTTLAASILDSGKYSGKDEEQPNLEGMARRFGNLLPAFEPMCSSCDQFFINQYETEAIITAMEETDHNEQCVQTPSRCQQYQKLDTSSVNSCYPQYYILFYGTCRNKQHTNTDSTQRFYDDITSEWIEEKKSFVKLEHNSPLALTFAASYQQSFSEVQTWNQQEKAATPPRTDIPQAGDVQAITQVASYTQQDTVTTLERGLLACTDPSCTDTEQAGNLETATEVATCCQQEKASISDEESSSPDEKISYTDKEQEHAQKIACDMIQNILSGWFSSPDEAASCIDNFQAFNQDIGSGELQSGHQLDQAAISGQLSLKIAEEATTDVKQAAYPETSYTFPRQVLSTFISLLNARKGQTYQRHRYIYVFPVDNQNLTKEITRWCVNSNKIISMTKLRTPVFLLGAEGLHGYIYIAGTINSCDNILVQRYFPLTGLCECLKTPDNFYNCTSPLSKSVFVSENYLYVISQVGRHYVGHHLWCYNPVNDQWSIVFHHPDSRVFQKIINAWEKSPSP